MKICGPLSWNNELIWSVHKDSVAQMLKVILKQTLIFYRLDQKIYTWRTNDKPAAQNTPTHYSKITTVLNSFVYNRDVIPKWVILITWKWYLRFVSQIFKLMFVWGENKGKQNYVKSAKERVRMWVCVSTSIPVVVF